MILRVLLAIVFGAMVGVQRELTNEPAGLRTHILVAMGSAGFMALSVMGFQPLVSGEAPVASDRIAAQIVTGIGFLGAGTIWRTRSSIRGLTTAASIWVVAAIGMLTASGYFVLGGMVTLLTLITLQLLKIPERSLQIRRTSADDEEEEEDGSDLT